MRTSALLCLAAAAATSAHGIVSSLKIGATTVAGYNPFQDPYITPAPSRIVWAFPSAGNGPVEDVTSRDIVCNKGATAATVSQAAKAGDAVTFFWTEWPESHRGPVMTYLANCGGDCADADITALDFFKIDHAGLEAGVWVSDKIIADNNSYTVTLPADIKSGNYLLRHELLALHSAGNANGAQFYPMCANLVIEGTGSAAPAGVKFPGAYKPTDAGIKVDIYNGISSYTIPGPAVYVAGGAVAKPTTSAAAPAVPTTSAAASTKAPAPTTSAAAVTSTQAATTSAVAAPTTLVTATRPATSSAAATAAPTVAPVVPGTPKTSADINKCLDDVNDCIRKMHAGNIRGGTVDFSVCEAARAACY